MAAPCAPASPQASRIRPRRATSSPSAVAQAREAAGVIGLRLYVEHENGAALRTYRALGMRDAGYCIYEVELS
jgi:hypothetical protein